jgi:pteridine reductase
VKAPKVALITGAGRRLGAAISEALHGVGYHVVLHYRQSAGDAETLCSRLNRRREHSAFTVQGDLRETEQLGELVNRAANFRGGITALVNNASAFYPTPFPVATTANWDDLLTTNLKAPFFLAQAAAPYLARDGGTIVNIGDIHAERTLKDFSIYSITKAGLGALTKSLAKELAPEVRVNGIAPGAILWPESAADPDTEQSVLERIPLGRTGCAADIAEAVVFLVDRAPYVTGQMLSVDGGRTLFS